jgi:D-alanyl-D-alanine dipeptidase
MRGIIHFKVCLLLIAVFIGCNNNNVVEIKKDGENKQFSTNVEKDSTIISETVEDAVVVDSLEQILIDAGLVDIQSVCDSILIDLRYSTTNNFLNEDVYGNLNKVYLQPSVAKDLVKSQRFLQSIDSSLTLLIYDGVRPRSVQQKMWDILDMPINEKTKFVSNPKNGSIHNYGAAVDLTIAKLDGTPLDMGADFDDIRRIAYPRLEAQFLASGELTQQQVDNRKLLRKVMKAGGFYNIQTEWWHFNRYNRAKAKELFEIVE